LGQRARCRTKRLRLVGAEGHRDTALGSPDAHLRNRHGTAAAAVQHMIDTDSTLGDALVEGLPYLRAEAVYAVRHEMARSLDDVLSRRTRARLLDRAATSAAAPAVARLIGPELGWDDAQIAAQVAEFRALLSAERDAGTVTEADFIAQVTGVDR
jgi:glycerol-3-phosphate dehydrogenase